MSSYRTHSYFPYRCGVCGIVSVNIAQDPMQCPKNPAHPIERIGGSFSDRIAREKAEEERLRPRKRPFLEWLGLWKSPVGTSKGIETNPEVARDLGRILAAGLIAEQIAAERDNTLTPNPACAAPDHELIVQQLSRAGLSRKFDKLEADARAVLEENWIVVEALAKWLFQMTTAGYVEVNQFIADRI